MMTAVIGFFLFVSGLIFGSFLNVCIHRFPREESIVSPGSHCPHCRAPIAWRDNIPLVSFLALRGRCRSCGKRISVRYFLVELASGLLWLLLWMGYGLSGFFFAGVILISTLLAISVIDLETGYIPDPLTLPGLVAGFVLSTVFPSLHGESLWFRGALQSALGILAGGAIIFVMGLAGNIVFRRESMGGGDVKLLAMLGAYVGVKNAIMTFLLAPFVAMPFALYMKFVRKAETIPYGPFLAFTGAWFFIYGEPLSRLLLGF